MQIIVFIFCCWITYKIFKHIKYKYILYFSFLFITFSIAAGISAIMRSDVPIIIWAIILLFGIGYGIQRKAKSRIIEFFHNNNEGTMEQVIMYVRADSMLKHYGKKGILSILDELCKNGILIQVSDMEWMTLNRWIYQNIESFFEASAKGSLKEIIDFMNIKLKSQSISQGEILQAAQQLCDDGIIEPIGDNFWITTNEEIKRAKIKQVHIPMD